MSAIINFIAIVAVILLLGGIASWLARRRWRNQADADATLPYEHTGERED